MSINKVILIGNVGQNPEIRVTSSGSEVAALSLATSENWKDKNTGEKKTKTEWHKISIFSPGLVGVIKNYVKKGSKLYIEGKLQTKKYTDKSGIDRYTTEILLQGFDSKVLLLDSLGSSNIDKQETSPKPVDLGGDEIPF
jgi:single-strand DNA-binding protein